MPADLPCKTCGEADLDQIGRYWARDLERLRKRGPGVESQLLLDVILAQGVEGASLLDVGAGVGAVHLALLEAGAARAVDVDASREYLAAARTEAERRGLVDRVDRRYGDVVELAADLPPADIVTADSVIFCYPYLAPMLGALVRSRPQLVGLTYATDAWWFRAWMRLSDVVWVGEAGYAVIYDRGTWRWRVVVFRQTEVTVPVRHRHPDPAAVLQSRWPVGACR